MRQAIERRISRRTFLPTPLDNATQYAVRQLVEQANESSGLTIEFLEDGSAAFRSLKRSYGMFSHVRSLLLMKGPAQDPDLAEKIGYYGEDLVLDLTDLDLGTCWVAGTFDRNLLPPPEGERLVCVIVVGRCPAMTLKERAIRSSISRRRKPISQRLHAQAPVPAWITQAMEAVRLAPSAINSQKPVFTYDGTTVTASVSTDSPTDLIDLGIAKKHFAAEAMGHFALGNGAAFQKA